MTNELKSTTLELTINPGYVKSWGVWEACRELVQNAMDAHDQGFEMAIERGGGAAQTIYIRNTGTTLSRSALLLGTTSKDGGGFRGKFGEGLKLALLVLARKGIQIKVKTGGEIWKPVLGPSAAFGGEELLKIRVDPATYENVVEVQILGISDGDWDTIQSKLLNVPGLPSTKPAADEVIDLGYGQKILTGARFCGKLYAKGIYVGPLDGHYQYGYDLPEVELDRDRKMADVWSLQSWISRVLASAIIQGKLGALHIMDLLSRDSGEAVAIAARHEWGQKDELSAAVTKAFDEKFGEDAVPVASMGESLEAEHHALRGKMVSKAVKILVEKEKGKFEDRKKSWRSDARHLYGVDELTTEERENLLWACRLTIFAEPTFSLEKLQVVDFFGEGITGTFCNSNGAVRVSKHILVDKRELLATVVHEVAHSWGGDGSLSHERKIEMMFAEIAVRLSSR